ncbi:MAG: hypothetical protein K2X61_04505 [Caulobacteraceae bacterium]|nr:hypothetical protein [Caulobacteraceae bacterium]
MGYLKRFVVLPGLLTLAACTTTSPGFYSGGHILRSVIDRHEEPGRRSALVNCNVPSGHRLTADPASARPGETVDLRHSFEFSASGPQHIPLRCVDFWQIDPPEAATLSSDRRVLQVSDSAASGSEIRVTVTANGHAHTLVLPIVGANESGIQGNWRSVAQEGCFGSPAPVEVRFAPEGLVLFDLGLGPSIWDARQAYTFDRMSGALTVGDQSGTARFDESGNMVISGLELPSAIPPRPTPLQADGNPTELNWSGCELVFSRTGSFR